MSIPIKPIAGKGIAGDQATATFYDNTGGQVVSSASDITVNLDTTLTNNDTGIFSLASDEVTVNQTGVFLFGIASSASTNSGTRSTFKIWLEVDTGGGYALVPGSSCTAYTRMSGLAGGAATSVTLSVTTGDKFRIRADSNAVDNSIIVAGTSNLSVVALTGEKGNVGAEGGSVILIAEESAAGDASIIFDNIFTADYDAYKIIINDLVPATDSVDFLVTLRTSAGADDANTYTYGGIKITNGGVSSANNSSATSGFLFTDIGNVSDEGICLDMILYDPRNTTLKNMSLQGHRKNEFSVYHSMVGGGFLASSVALEGLKVAFSSGNIATGTIQVYGFKTT